MTSEDKVLKEIQDKINLLFQKIGELKVTEDERKAFIDSQADYLVKIADYKKHKLAFDKRVEEWNTSHP